MSFATEEAICNGEEATQAGGGSYAKLRQVDVLTSQGHADRGCDPLDRGDGGGTYFRWRNQYGGLKSDQVKRPKDFET